MTTVEQYDRIDAKFTQLRIEVAEFTYPTGAKPSISDLWSMATQLVIAEMKND